MMRKDEISSKADKEEDEEEGELKTTTTRKRRILKDAFYDGSKEQQNPMIIEAIKPKRQRMEFLEFRRENFEGVGRPQGDRGREMFSMKSNTNTSIKEEKKYSSEYYEAYGDARRAPLTVIHYTLHFLFTR